jgi:heat shock protein HslJ
MKLKMLANLTLTIFVTASAAFAQISPAGREWVATYLRGAKVGSAVPTIKLDSDGSRFTGNTGCNIMNGSIGIAGNKLSFSAVITTKRACTRETAPLESAMLSALQKATRFQASPGQFRMYSGRVLIAEFASRAISGGEHPPLNPADQLRIDDRKWILDSVNGVPIPKVEHVAFIVFDPEKGSAGGDTSCNAYGGDYIVNGDKISITQVISTMRACVEDERMNIEREFLDGLRIADRFEIKTDRLMFYRRGKLLLAFTGEKK